MGPVREAFLIDDKFEGGHRGIGFVKFVLADDAGRALAAEGGVAVAGKRVAVDVANKRDKLEKGQRRTLKPRAEDAQGEAHKAARKARREAKDAQAKAAAAAAAATAAAAAAAAGANTPVGSLAACTVVLAAKTAGALAELCARASKLDGFERLKKRVAADSLEQHGVPEALPRGLEDHVATVEYGSVTAARAVVEAVHEPPASRWARQLGGEGAKARRWRVIVRNLAWAATEGDVAAALSEGGFVWDVAIPSDKGSGRRKGFAFVAFTCRAHAERAIAKVNGTAIRGRPVAVDWAVAKSVYLKATGEGEGGDDGEGAGAEAAVVDGDDALSGDADAEGESDDDSDSDGEYGREDAGEQGAASGDADLTKEQSAMGSVLDRLLGTDGDGAEGDEAAEDDGSDEDGESGSDEEDDDVDPKTEQDTGNDAPSEKAEEADAGPAEKIPPWRRSGGADPIERTVFMRNLSLDSTAMDVRKALKQFGLVRAARLVVNKATGAPNGTCFVEFQSADAAKRCARHGVHMGGLLVGGARTEVNMAVRREDAAALAAKKAATRGQKGKDMGRVGADPKDRRNLYLATEGAIPEASDAAADMSSADAAKRRRFAAEKKEKLKSPNYFVSATRLSVRNLGPRADDKALRKVALDAVRARSSSARPVLKHVKVLFDAEAGRSRGAGFVEFAEHEHALACLRHLNNNPKVSGFDSNRRPIVEFAIEDVRALRKRAGRMLREKRASAAAAEGDAGEGAPKAKPKGRGARQREAKRRHAAEGSDGAGEEGAVRGEEGAVPSDAKRTKKGAGGDDTGAGISEAGKGRRKKSIKPSSQAALGKKPEAKPAMAKDLQPTKGKDKRRRKDKSDGQPSEPKAEPKAKRKPAKRKREQRDGLDDKIHQYFARGESGSGGGKKPKSGGDLDRWFD